MRKQSKQSISAIQRKIWEECRRIANTLYPSTCYTCDTANLSGSNKQLGHLWPKSTLGANLKYDMRVLRWQCAACNIWRGGNGAEYYSRMLAEHGKKYMDALEGERKISVKAMDFYVELLDKYKALI
jgi:hypothetical protein